ncbi:hypothetical protein [Conexibacter sp. CPCC 206217]|uniref:hypothetical protein n=1 Tax=Conexibacter sp. CPCC 206217 TaxID=3064574 RepID=UPI002728512D|nr:hypothetical protein [Conexibacter sp. CPCC 206217]MDO8210047.1 hypothetical protein [Conexibacter sp. CPCC 206217]
MSIDHTKLFHALDLPAGDLHDHPSSPLSFPDGGEYRIEIATAEGLASIEASVATALELGVPVHRFTQGSGAMLLTAAELTAMAQLGAEHGAEVCIFVGPRGPWDGTASPHTPQGGVFGWRNFGMDQLGYAVRDVQRAVRAGVRSICVADEGLLWLLAQARARGELPAELILKVSALAGIANPVQARMLAQAGADTINVASDTSLARLAAFRAVTDRPLDLYVESPDALGGFARQWEIGEIVRVAAPVHLKFALKNAPNHYPAGRHHEGAVVAGSIERVRRAAAALEILRDVAPQARCSPGGVGAAPAHPTPDSRDHV